jgi:hypothetical protein
MRASILTIATIFLFAGVAFAQTTATPPAGSTGLCKDGAYWTGATKSGACRGHKGIQTWYGAAATPTTATNPMPAAQAAPAPAPTAPAPPEPSSAPAPMRATAAPGGGTGQVWVNTPTKVYHCSTDRYYGKTKSGSYMSEQAAVAAGDRPAYGKACH